MQNFIQRLEVMNGIFIRFLCVPHHAGIPGNVTDRLARVVISTGSNFVYLAHLDVLPVSKKRHFREGLDILIVHSPLLKKISNQRYPSDRGSHTSASM